MSENDVRAQISAEAARHAAIVDKEVGLQRHLTPRQLSMIAIGGAIGTGLFLGSAISVKLAGPGVILSYVAAGAIALCVMWALRWTLGRMGLFYIGGLAIVVGIVPWNQVGLGESPFVRVFETVGIPAAAGVMNFVVLTAALSSVNCNLYLMARMLFSLSRGGYAPAAFGKLSKRGTPVVALLVSSAGMCAALGLDHWFHDKAYVYMLGSAFLGGIFVWQMIFVTHLAFRRHMAASATPIVHLAPKGPWTSLIGLIALTLVLISTWWIPGLKITLVAGVPWLVFISLCYLVWARAKSAAIVTGATGNG